MKRTPELAKIRYDEKDLHKDLFYECVYCNGDMVPDLLGDYCSVCGYTVESSLGYEYGLNFNKGG